MYDMNQKIPNKENINKESYNTPEISISTAFNMLAGDFYINYSSNSKLIRS